MQQTGQETAVDGQKKGDGDEKAAQNIRGRRTCHGSIVSYVGTVRIAVQQS